MGGISNEPVLNAHKEITQRGFWNCAVCLETPNPCRELTKYVFVAHRCHYSFHFEDTADKSFPFNHKLMYVAYRNGLWKQLSNWIAQIWVLYACIRVKISLCRRVSISGKKVISGTLLVALVGARITLCNFGMRCGIYKVLLLHIHMCSINISYMYWQHFKECLVLISASHHGRYFLLYWYSDKTKCAKLIHLRPF